jgi:hypothetical protein
MHQMHKPASTKRKVEWFPMCPMSWKSSCELQGMYGLQGPTKENTPTSPFKNIHSSRTNQTYPMHSTRSNISSKNQTKFLHSHKYRAMAKYNPDSSANQRYARIKKVYEKPFWTDGNYDEPPHNLVKYNLNSYNSPCGTPTANGIFTREFTGLPYIKIYFNWHIMMHKV